MQTDTAVAFTDTNDNLSHTIGFVYSVTSTL